MSDEVLKIDLNEEYKIKIEEPSELEKSYFKEIYLKAGKATADILENSKASKKDKKPFARQKEEYNNIIAFCGERGTGKSSAMITFAQSLVAIKETKKFYDKIGCLKDHSFRHIDVIDPSMFEDNEHIFEVILSQLFSCFTRELNDVKSHDLDQKRKVLELFQKVYENLKTVQKNGDKYNGEALETLSKLACGANLRNNFSNLVQEYLKFIQPQNHDKSCLIIPIDDFDLNVKAVATMAEQIRKYLMIPNVIILMAADIKQLSDAKEQSVINEFKVLIDKNRLNEDTRIITEKYISKLIPAERRLSLPSITSTCKTTILKILPFDNNDEVEKNRSLLKRLQDSPSLEESTPEEIKRLEWKCSEKNIEEYICSLLYEKTGLVFIPNAEEKHFIVPSNLRNVKDLILSLAKKKDDKNKHFLEFKEFFYLNILPEKLGQKDLDLINDFQNTETSKKNKQLIDNYKHRKIEEYISINRKEPESDYKALKFITKRGVSSNNKETKYHEDTIIDRNNIDRNISIADVFYFFGKMKTYNNNKKHDDFYNAIKCIYTLELHQQLIIENDPLKAQMLFGESFFTDFNDDKIIPTTKKGNRRQFIQFEISKLFKDEMKNTSKEIEIINYYISHYGDNYEDRRKQKRAPYFLDEIVINNNIINQNNATFNIFSFISNSLNPRGVYNRLKPSILEIDKASETCQEINIWREKYQCVLPIYSIDFIEMIFNKDFYNVKFSSIEESNLFNMIKIIAEEILKRLGKININGIANEKFTEAFEEAPFIAPFLKKDTGLMTMTGLSILNNTDICDNLIGLVNDYDADSNIRFIKDSWQKILVDGELGIINKYLNDKSGNLTLKTCKNELISIIESQSLDILLQF